MLNNETLQKTRVVWFFVCWVVNKERRSAKVKTRVLSRHPSSSAIRPSSWLDQETHFLLMLPIFFFLRHLETLVTPVRLATEATTFHSDECVGLKLHSNLRTMFCVRPSLTLAVEHPALYGFVFSLQSCSLTWDLVKPPTETSLVLKEIYFSLCRGLTSCKTDNVNICSRNSLRGLFRSTQDCLSQCKA